MHPNKLNEYDHELYELLRVKRTELARAEGVLSFIVFHNQTLQEMATYFPQSPEAFRTIHGVGPVKVEKYAGEFLPIIRAYCEGHGLSEQPRSTPVVMRTVRDRSRSYESAVPDDVDTRLDQIERKIDSLNEKVERLVCKCDTIYARLVQLALRH